MMLVNFASLLLKPKLFATAHCPSAYGPGMGEPWPTHPSPPLAKAGVDPGQASLVQLCVPDGIINPFHLGE